MSERIQPENNRTFTAGPGTWAGPLVWEGSVYDGRQGHIYLDIDTFPSTKSISLAYPAIKPIPDQDNDLSFWIAELASTGNDIEIDFEITDGVYTFGPYHSTMVGLLTWTPFAEPLALPSDWDTINTILKISISSTVGALGKVAFDDFSLSAPAPKPQYLPILGIG